MENQDRNSLFKPETSVTEESESFSNKNLIIIVLISVLVLSFLGINLLSFLGEIFQKITNIFGPIIGEILSFFGYTTGSVINKTADVVGDSAKTGIDIASGTVHSVGDLLKNASANQVNTTSRTNLDTVLNDNGNNNSSPHSESHETSESDETSKPAPPPEPAPTPAENPVQKPITASKIQWCLVGEYKEKRGCVAFTDSDKCLSGQIFPSQQLCLNPTFTPNV